MLSRPRSGKPSTLLDLLGNLHPERIAAIYWALSRRIGGRQLVEVLVDVVAAGGVGQHHLALHLYDVETALRDAK